MEAFGPFAEVIYLIDLAGFIFRNAMLIVAGVWLFLIVATPIPKDMVREMRKEWRFRKSLKKTKPSERKKDAPGAEMK